MKIRNLQSLLVCPIILWKSSVLSVEWISGWRSWLASRIQSCVWVLTFTRYMRWSVFRYFRNPRIESSWIRWWRRRWWISKKSFPTYHAYPKCLAACCCGSAFPENGLAFHQDHDQVGSNAGWLGTWDSPLRTDSASLKSLESLIQLTSFCSSWILAVSSLIVSDFRLIFFSKIHRLVTLELSSMVTSHEDFWYELHEDPDFVLIVVLDEVVDLVEVVHHLQ